MSGWSVLYAAGRLMPWLGLVALSSTGAYALEMAMQSVRPAVIATPATVAASELVVTYRLHEKLS